jgi:hypothetical protein
MVMGRRKKLIVIAAAVVCVAVIGVGTATAAAGLGDEEPGATTPSTESVATTLPAAVEDVAPSATTETTLQPFGQTISDLRHAGDHTPAAVLMGKDVPGWDPDKHAGQGGDGVDEDDAGDKDHVPAAVLMGKKVPGQSKK